MAYALFFYSSQNIKFNISFGDKIYRELQTWVCNTKSIANDLMDVNHDKN